MKLGIGIDTGGTYTDAVIYDFETDKILGSAKSLTTKEDLVVGILESLDALPLELTKQAEMISLSTTLATNACVEDKSGRAKLIFFGGDRDIIDKNGKQYGLPGAEEIYIQDMQDCGEHGREPDWELFRKQIKSGFSYLDGVGIIEMNSMRTGAAIEKKAKEIFREQYSVPVVCGHELFSELNSLQRGASTLLNAGLFPVIRDFLEAVKQALSVRNISVPLLVILRSDGSLMSEEFASLHPVETLLCGPAASAVGCAHLTDNPNSIMVDMGGTTTDIALLKNGVPVKVTEGVSIGKWKTFVNGLYIKTLGLGGDSALHYDEKGLIVEDYRVMPLCVAADKYPSVADNLRKLQVKKHTRFLYEHYLLVKDISDSPVYTDKEKAFCKALQKGPLPVTEAAGAVGEEIYTLNVNRLIKDGIVEICGLTPTDIMHLRGDFQTYHKEASLLAAEFAAYNMGISVWELCDLVYDQVKRKLYVSIVKALLENKYVHYMKNGVSQEVEQLICEAYEEAKTAETGGSLLSLTLRTDYSLVGVGAPVGIFLEDVAKMLGAKAVIPQHHEVANALGAIMGSISAVRTVEIRQEIKPEGGGKFIVYAKEQQQTFDTLEEAIVYAVSQAEEMAREEAVKRGAKGEISVTTKISDDEASAKTGAVYLGTTVTAQAVGALGF